MSIETELKLQLSKADAERLASLSLFGVLPVRERLHNTYFDTPDRRLDALRVAIRFRRKGWRWLLTVKSASPACGGLAQRNEWEAPAIPGRFDFAMVDDEPLRARLEELSASLVPLFETNFTRLRWQVPVGEGVVEVALDRGWIISAGRRIRLCELELELLEGQVADLFTLANSLQQELNLRPMVVSKAERGYALFDGKPRKPAKAASSPLQAGMSPIGAFRTIALDCLEHLQRNEVSSLTDSDPEFVHQARVALRRMRSALRLFQPVLPQVFVDAYGGAWRTLASALGEARDWDVFVAETLPPLARQFPESRDVKRLHAEGRRRSAAAQRAVVALFAGADYPRILLGYTAKLLELPENGEGTLQAFSRSRLELYSRKARRLARRLDGMGAEERHELRISLKKLRYALEFFAPLLPRRRCRAYVTALTQLQDVLGMINDHVTATGLVETVLDVKRPGLVHGWMAGRHELLLAELPPAVATWRAQQPPWKHL